MCVSIEGATGGPKLARAGASASQCCGSLSLRQPLLPAATGSAHALHLHPPTHPPLQFHPDKNPDPKAHAYFAIYIAKVGGAAQLCGAGTGAAPLPSGAAVALLEMAPLVPRFPFPPSLPLLSPPTCRRTRR